MWLNKTYMFDAHIQPIRSLIIFFILNQSVIVGITPLNKY